MTLVTFEDLDQNVRQWQITQPDVDAAFSVCSDEDRLSAAEYGTANSRRAIETRRPRVVIELKGKCRGA